MPTISDDYFLFLVIDRIFSFFPVFTVCDIWYITYMALFLMKNLYFRTNNFFMIIFLLSSYFHMHPITLLLEILGGRMHGLSPPQILGDRLPVPPKSPPMDLMTIEAFSSINGKWKLSSLQNSCQSSLRIAYLMPFEMVNFVVCN